MNPYIQLQAAKGIGTAAQRAVLNYAIEHNVTLNDFFALPLTEQKLAGLNQNQSEALAAAHAMAKEWQQKLDELQIQIVGWLDDAYPERLKRVLGDQAPPVLYLWGNLDLLRYPAVGFCGARNASEQGIEVARDTAHQVAKEGWVVVSGHARGIDTTAHHVALSSESATVIVAPEGILNFRLRPELRPLANKENTLIISEFQPNAHWSVINAMTRNRTICGLSDALVIIESGASGGTFEAGKYALSTKVPLFVVEYAHPEESAAGNPYFLQRSAQALRRNRLTGQANLQELFAEVASHYEHITEPIVPIATQQSLFALEEVGF
jgi:DNA protecting protein DprA